MAPTEKRRHYMRHYIKLRNDKQRELAYSKELQKQIDELGDVITTNEVAAILGVHPWTVRRWCRLGRMPHFKVMKAGETKGHIFIPVAALNLFKRGFESLKGVANG